jgi:hypothetical protein
VCRVPGRPYGHAAVEEIEGSVAVDAGDHDGDRLAHAASSVEHRRKMINVPLTCVGIVTSI